MEDNLKVEELQRTKRNATFSETASVYDKEKPRHCEVESTLEMLLEWAADTFGENELVAAKEEFFWKTGKVFYDDPFYNTRMSYFQDYFLFQRPLEVNEKEYRNKSPFTAYSERNCIRHTLAISGTLHSIFQVIKCQPDKLWVSDLLDSDTLYEIVLRPGQSFCGINKKNVFQGFIYASTKLNVLSYGIVFHPREAINLIKRQAKSHRNSDNSEQLRVLSRWAHLHIRHLRHFHVDPKRIYEDPLR